MFILLMEFCLGMLLKNKNSVIKNLVVTDTIDNGAKTKNVKI